MKWVDAPIWVKIGRNIKHCREWKGFAPGEVASKAKIDLKRYKQLERAIVKDITYDETLMIARALRVDQDQIDYH